MKYLPLHHDFVGRRCLVVGGGRVAARRAARVIDAGGRVDVVAVAAGDELKRQVEAAGGTVQLRAFAPGDLDGAAAASAPSPSPGASPSPDPSTASAPSNPLNSSTAADPSPASTPSPASPPSQYQLVIAATDDRAVNRRVAAECKRRGLPVNVVDDARLCDVVFPLTIDRDPITISVASGAASPTLARLLGARIQSLLPSGYGELARLVSRFRKQAQARIPDTAARIKFWEDILQGVVAESVFSGQFDEAERLLTQALESPAHATGAAGKIGEVYLIGAGPGDPDLLTLRAFRLLQSADVVLYDRLVAPEILRMLRADTESIYVGKQRAAHALPQPGINRMLSDYARAGKRVARLKGGDPFIFGRGGEEIEHLAEQGIPFQVIPGITAASGCASYAGIPLTHREHAQSVRFVTGQLQDGSVNLDWESLVAPGQTLVFYMSLNGLPLICEKLLAFGLSPSLPVALIEKGTTLRQKVYVSTLGEMRAELTRAAPRAPTLFIAGKVVSLRRKLNWFGT